MQKTTFIHMMMKTRISILSAICMMLSLMACGTNRQVVKPGAGAARQLQVTDFNAIENSSVVTVRLRAGSRLSVKAENYDPKVDNIYVKGRTLHIESRRTKGPNNRKTRLTLTITAPRLQAVSNSGVMNMDTERWKCTDLKLQNAGVANIHLRQISCNSLTCTNAGVITFECSGSAKKATLTNEGQSNGQLDLASDNLKINNSGVGHLQIHFKGTTIDIRNSGQGNIHADVDCTRLTAYNSGIGDFEIVGTADDTKIDTDGQAHITTKNLNKF